MCPCVKLYPFHYSNITWTINNLNSYYTAMYWKHVWPTTTKMLSPASDRIFLRWVMVCSRGGMWAVLVAASNNRRPQLRCNGQLRQVLMRTLIVLHLTWSINIYTRNWIHNTKGPFTSLLYNSFKNMLNIYLCNKNTASYVGVILYGHDSVHYHYTDNICKPILTYTKWYT